jgi:hypothetical protein
MPHWTRRTDGTEVTMPSKSFREFDIAVTLPTG